MTDPRKATSFEATMTVDELVDLITHPSGEIYPFSYAANMMAAHGVNSKLVKYFHDAAANQNRASHDRNQILSDYKSGVPYDMAHMDSVLRNNPHMIEASR